MQVGSLRITDLRLIFAASGQKLALLLDLSLVDLRAKHSSKMPRIARAAALRQR
jgi:hypothetical protein